MKHSGQVQSGRTFVKLTVTIESSMPQMKKDALKTGRFPTTDEFWTTFMTQNGRSSKGHPNFKKINEYFYMDGTTVELGTLI